MVYRRKTMKTAYKVSHAGKFHFGKSGMVGILFFFFLGNAFLSSVTWGDKIWTGGNGSWDDNTWNGTSGTIYIGGGSEAGGGGESATVKKDGDLTLLEKIYIGYDSHTFSSDKYPGAGTLEVTGSFSTTSSVYLGQQYRNTTSSGAGNLIVGNGLNIGGSLFMGRDGNASLTVAQGSVSIGSGADSDIYLGEQLYHSDLNADDYYTQPIKLDLSGTNDVTVNVDGFYIAATPGTKKSLNGYPDNGNYRYQYSADVDFGTHTTITAKEMVVASSYGVNLINSEPTTVEFGKGDTKLYVDDFYIGYWKSENLVGGTDSDLTFWHNTVSIRETTEGENVATFTLQGKEEGTKANLYIGYQDCDTGNIATGTLDLSNASQATLLLDELYIGFKSEQRESSQRRTAASEGLLVLGNNATLTANKIQIAYKELTNIPKSSENKLTRGKLKMGGTSTVTTDELHLGNSDNNLLLTYSYLDLSGNSQFLVNNGATFYDNISIKMSDNANMTIHQGAAAQVLNMYANLKMHLSDNTRFIIDGSISETLNQINGYAYVNMGDTSQFLMKGNSSLTQDAIFFLGDQSLYHIEGNMVFQAGDVIIITKPSESGESESTDPKRGQLSFSTTSEARIHIDGNLTSKGQNVFYIASDDSSQGLAMHITGNATFDSTIHTEVTYTVDSTGVLQKTGERILTDKQIEFNAENGTTQIDGDTTVTGKLNIEVTGGTFRTRDLIVNGKSGINAAVNITVMEGLLDVRDAYRDQIGSGIDFKLVLAGGRVDQNGHVAQAKVKAQNIGFQEDESQSIHSVTTLHFYGGTLVVEKLGSDYTPYYLDQSVHTYNDSECTYSILSPGDNGTYGSTTITGKTYTTDGQHTYNIANGTIQLDLSSNGRDNLTVLGSMNMTNATFDIHVNGSVLLGLDEKDGEMIAYITLVSAEEFYKNGEVVSFTGDFENGDFADFKWTGDDTEWKYYISPLQTSGLSSSGLYELRAYRSARTDEVPEPSTMTLMFLGIAVMIHFSYRKKRLA